MKKKKHPRDNFFHANSSSSLPEDFPTAIMLSFSGMDRESFGLAEVKFRF